MEVNLVEESLKFMALGMSIVFAFLTIMIFALKLQAKLIGMFFDNSKSTNKSKELQSSTKNNKNIIAAITAAIIYNNSETNNKG